MDSNKISDALKLINNILKAQPEVPTATYETLSNKSCHVGRNIVSNYILKENKKIVKQYETIEPAKNKMYKDIATKEANSKEEFLQILKEDELDNVNQIATIMDNNSDTQINYSRVRKELYEWGDVYIWTDKIPVNTLLVQDEDLVEKEIEGFKYHGLEIDETTKPIIVLGNWDVIDGRHRTVKAKKQGISTLVGYVPADIWYDLEIKNNMRENNMTGSYFKRLNEKLEKLLESEYSNWEDFEKIDKLCDLDKSLDESGNYLGLKDSMWGIYRYVTTSEKFDGSWNWSYKLISPKFDEALDAIDWLAQDLLSNNTREDMVACIKEGSLKIYNQNLKKILGFENEEEGHLNTDPKWPTGDNKGIDPVPNYMLEPNKSKANNLRRDYIQAHGKPSPYENK